MSRPSSVLLVVGAMVIGHPGRAHEPLLDELAVLESSNATPARADLLLRRGELRRIRGETDRALADFERARELGAAPGEIERLRARALLEVGRSAEARDAALLARGLEPASGEARLLEAHALAALGRRGEAAQAYDRALDAIRDPSPDLYLERAALASEKEAALAVLDSGLARLGAVASLELRAIELECDLGRVDAALTRLAGLTDRSARKSPWLLRRAEILARAGRADEARRSLRDARRVAAAERGAGATPAESALALSIERAVRGAPAAEPGS